MQAVVCVDAFAVMGYLDAVRQSKKGFHVLNVLNQHICTQLKQWPHTAGGPMPELVVSAWGPADSSFAR